MYPTTTAYQAAIAADNRMLRASLSVGNTIFNDSDALKSVLIESGFGSTEKLIGNAISAKMTAEIVNTIAVPSLGSKMKVRYWPDSIPESDAVPSIEFILENIETDEDSSTYTLIGHDAMTLLQGHTATEITIEYPTTLYSYANAAAQTAGLQIADETWLNSDITLPSPPNLDGDESCRDIISWAAQCAFGNAYIDRNGDIAIKSIIPSVSRHAINPDLYFECEIGSAYGPINTLTLARLPQGDNVYREDADSVLNQGRIEIQIADNPFLDAIRDDVIDTMFSQIKGTIIQPYTLDWCADPALDPGDTITLTDTNNSTKVSLYGAESLDFDGGLRTSVELKSPSNETINYSQAASTKEILRRTRIQVDKVNQKIDFEASRTDGLTGNIAAIQLTTDQISQSVSSIQEDNNALKSRVATLENDSQSVSIKIQKIIDDGVDKVTTSTGYTFDEDGLHISKSGEEMENRLDNTGLYVERSGDIVLKANNEGVEAENVTVRTYLTVGKNSRFEDYDNGTRTGCFWVGR